MRYVNLCLTDPGRYMGLAYYMSLRMDTHRTIPAPLFSFLTGPVPGCKVLDTRTKVFKVIGT